jgi:lipopolysaccharide assembly protein A
MKQIAWFLRWFLKFAVFFTLFAFALNNQNDATVHFFFGTYWTAPMVLLVLTAFATGLIVGVLGMLPRWWQQRQATPAPPYTSPQPSTALDKTLPTSTHGL